MGGLEGFGMGGLERFGMGGLEGFGMGKEDGEAPVQDTEGTISFWLC